ncbi:MAG TPA: methionine gamma-lyase family protein [Candidatus Ornithomonoglobus intestinigallinarum]|uniref:Methionine gamma-lyase family protein n=1 Tax=Candidatus Ornithomonoglobus intestinigallinarum TaxID=2840894 RepID=A0A9D1KQJ4_9FIRM|nr:methionine gamma-lyase family protein [Candidatus Ornithomonoglobus intestinigallinarum]
MNESAKAIKKNKFMREALGLSDSVINLAELAENALKEQFARVDDTAQINQWRVMKAFADNRVSEAHFAPTTGYGYDDLGRDTLDKVYADIFGTEDALVRHNFVNGTHALSTMLFGVLRPGDHLVSATGKPYDTLEEAIGISGKAGSGSLKDFGVTYTEIPLANDGNPDFDELAFTLSHMNVRAVMIQRSKGYGRRPTYSAEKIGEIVSFVKERSPETICIVDNCYGEFADIKEPTHFGADLAAGSLIKNPGGGIAPCGGYIAGRADLVELCAYRLTSVGIGKECGASLGLNRQLYQGLFMAPHITAQAIKSALFCSAVFEKLGFDVDPLPTEARHDIIQSIQFGDPEKVKAFCRGIQKGAPVDSFVTPEPWDMPGYSDQVIMAAGAFVQGSSIELSADAPMREPYMVYMQGGLTYESAKLGIMVAADKIMKL